MRLDLHTVPDRSSLHCCKYPLQQASVASQELLGPPLLSRYNRDPFLSLLTRLFYRRRKFLQVREERLKRKEKEVAGKEKKGSEGEKVVEGRVEKRSDGTKQSPSKKSNDWGPEGQERAGQRTPCP